MLANGSDPEQVLAQLARSLTNKFLHAPTAAMKKASAEGRGEVIDIARELFRLDEPSSEKSDD